ncbi:MAG: HAMP domain-containing sensor histidine kinase [Myxococcota bacterium]
MSPAALFTASFALLALCLAIFNLWIYAQRPREAAHLWLAVAATGTSWLAAGSSALYGATTLAEAQTAQLVAFASGLPLVVGFARFTEAYLKHRVGPALRVAPYYTAAVVLVPTLEPDWFFTGTALAARVEPFGQAYVLAALSPLAVVALAGFLPIFVEQIWTYARSPVLGREARPLSIALAIWCACALNDTGAFLGLHHGPHLAGLGFCIFACLFTALLLRRFVEASARIEASAEALQAEVDERTRRLRESDLAVAHGARMATVGALAAGLAHDIHNPITLVTGNLDELARRWHETERERFDALLDETREGVERVRRVVSELLRLARRAEGPEGPVDLGRVVESILPIVGPEARSRARIAKRLDPVPRVQGEERLLGQIVLNLIVHALRSIPAGEPEAHEVRVETRFADGAVLLRIRDDGPAIAPERLPRLFDPFAAAGEESGPELGLAVTQQLVARHRGRIDVETSDHGTTFSVHLPPAEAEDAA